MHNMKTNILLTYTANKQRRQKYFRDENLFLKKYMS